MGQFSPLGVQATGYQLLTSSLGHSIYSGSTETAQVMFYLDARVLYLSVCN